MVQTDIRLVNELAAVYVMFFAVSVLSSVAGEIIEIKRLSLLQ